MADVITILQNGVVTTEVTGADVLLPMAIAAASVEADRAEVAANAAEAFLNDALDIAASGDDAAAIAARAKRDGSNLTGGEPAQFFTALDYTPAGTGAVAGKAQDKIRSLAAAPEGYSGTTSARLLAALTASQDVLLAKGATYELETLVNASALQNRRLYLNGATIGAASGFTGTHLLSIAGDCQIIGPGRFLGTNVPAPTGAYASGVYAGVGVFITGTGNDGLIDGVLFEDFQSGPILHDSATTRSGLKVRMCVFLTNQKYTANATNALVAFHGVTGGLQEHCRASGYNWKGFYSANGSFNKIVDCHAIGGAVGHASHFLEGGSDNEITDCSHTGIGFGVKIDNETRPVVANFQLAGGVTAVYVQSCRDFKVLGGYANDPTSQAIIIDAANGDCVRGLVDGFSARRTVLGTTTSHVGVLIQPFAAGVIDEIKITNSYFESFLWGIYTPNSGFASTNISIIDNVLKNINQYGVIAYWGSAVISGNKIDMDGAGVESAIFVNRDSVTTGGVLEISNNVLSRCTADNIEIEGRLNYKSVRIIDNRSDGGTVFLKYAGNGNAADTVSVLEVVGNQAVGVTTGISATFNTTTSTRFRRERNTFINTSFVPVGDSLTNLTNVTNLTSVQRGTATLAAGTVAVTLPIQEPNTSYQITLSGNAAETFSWASKATSGFTINSSNGSSTASVDWSVSR